MRSLFLSLLLVAAPFAANAQIYDVSGADATNLGQSGAAGGRISVEIGFVPGSDSSRVYVRGYSYDERNGQKEINDTYATEQLNELIFVGNGGNGATGPQGSTGVKGVTGTPGTNGRANFFDDNPEDSFGRTPSYFNGGKGGTGGTGGQGGQGLTGGNAGPGGSVTVTLAEGSELLAPLVQVQAKAGQPGEGGPGGPGGPGGEGGPGGSRACGDVLHVTYNCYRLCVDSPQRYLCPYGSEYSSAPNCMKKPKKVEHTNYECGIPGDMGDRGSQGSVGFKGNPGNPASDGKADFSSTNGQKFLGAYSLVVSDVDSQEAIPDGIFESDEPVTISGFTIRSSGRSDVPNAHYVFRLAGKVIGEFDLDLLKIGAIARINLPAPVKLKASEMSNGLPLTVSLSHVRTVLGLPRGLVIGKPVEIASVNSPTLTQINNSGEIKIIVNNLSSATYGTDGSLGRALRVRVQPLAGAENLLITDPSGNRGVLDHDLVLDIPSIAAKGQKLFTLPVEIKPGTPVGNPMKFAAILDLQFGNDMGVVSQKESAVGYTLDISTPINRFEQKVEGANVVCTYPNRFGKDHKIKTLWIRKAQNSNIVIVSYDPAGAFFNSPEYQVDVNDIGFLLDDVVNNRQLSREKLINLMVNVVGTYSRNNKQEWVISGCR